MNDNELTTSDVLADFSKNLCNIYRDDDDDEDNNDSEPISLSENAYYTESEFIDFVESQHINNTNNLTIISINIANILSKLSSLKKFVSYISSKGNKPDIIIVVETHITDHHAGLDAGTLGHIVPGYQFFHKGRGSRNGGGVGILVNDDIKSEPTICSLTEKKVKFCDEKFENIVVRIPGCINSNWNGTSKDLLVVAIYRQPNSENLETFLGCFEKLLNTIDKSKNEIVIAGDMNLDLLKYESHLPTSKYLDTMTNHRILPRIVRPTRIKKQSATLIDHILTRDNANTLVSGIIDTELAGSSGYTDHKPIFTILRSKLPRKDKNSKISISYFTQEGHMKRRDGLLTQNWDHILSQNDPNVVYDQMIRTYDHHYKSNMITKQIKPRSNTFRREPWMTDDILRDIRRRDRLSKLKHRRAEYKSLRNDIVSRTRKAEKTFLQQQVQDSMGDIKRHWKILRGTINKSNNKEDITTEFLYQGRWIKDQQTNADNMNSYLASVGPETNESVGTSTNPPKYYLDKFKAKNAQAIMLTDISDETVLDVCRSLTPKSSVDPSGFKQNLVLQDASIFPHVLAHLVNCSLKAGVCPDNSKVARVVPLYKQKGSKNLYENYRPISLLSVFSKIMEKLIYNKIFEFLVRQDILFKSQFGFRRGHNTTHATLDFVKTIEDALVNDELAIGVFCDLSKAFDTINHDVLLEKLDHYGIRGTFNDWFRTYLSGREQYVDWNGKQSNKLPITTGVPQGSILGPLLFLIYINDLPSASKLKTVLFADDSNFLIRGKSLSTLADTLNKELKLISDFFKANKLKLNAKKTKLVCFRKKSLHIDYDSIKVQLDGETLKFEEQTVFLGINIDSHLSWDKHCIKVANTISRNGGAISRVKKLLPPTSLKVLYNSLILPHLQYGLSAWGGCSTQSKKRITLIQKRITRIISKSFYSSHTEPRMKKLGLLKFDDLYSHQCLSLIHDTINDRAPLPVKELVTLTSQVHAHSLRGHSSDPHNIRVPMSRSKLSSNSFCSKGPQLWNQLPQEIKTIVSKQGFKFKLKHHLLNSYDPTTQCNNPRCTDRKHHHHPDPG